MTMFNISILFYIFLPCIISFKIRQTLSSKLPQVNIRKILEDAEVIPLVIDDVPNELCTVVYGNQTIIPGQFVKGLLTKDPPKVTWKADDNSYYLLFFSGLTRWLPLNQIPGREQPSAKDVEWENWVVINIPGCNVSAGNILADYMAPGYPIRDNLREKFTIFIYEQPYKYNYHSLRDNLKDAFPKEITLRNFVKKYKLTDPIAVNYFYTEWDESFRFTMSSLRWLDHVLYNGSTTPMFPEFNTSELPDIDYKGIIKKFGWENYTLSPDQLELR